MPTKKKTASKKKAVKKVASKAAKTARPSKKKTTRKAAKATRATKTSASKKKSAQKRVLVCANGKQCFWTTDGQVLTSLVDLRDSLEHMVDDVYAYHVTKEKNDFADWVESVLDDLELAAALRRSRKASTARTVVVRHLKFYNV